ncbi:MAG: hypothetical protein ACOYO1_01275 [Bacteroidales bacterium]
MKIKHLTLFLLISTLIINSLKSQNSIESDTNSSNFKLNISADIVSRFIWRGNDYGNSPAIQPTLSINFQNLEIGCWGSVATYSYYTEIDLYAKYTMKKISFIITDYFVPATDGNPMPYSNSFLNFKDKTTAHAFEASIAYKGSDNFPLSLLGAIYFYGNDKRWGYDLINDMNEKTYFSSYFEATYTFSIHENSLDIFAGITPYAGAYGHKAGIVNFGVTGNRKIKITDSFELPLKASLILNPLASNVYFSLGISL